MNCRVEINCRFLGEIAHVLSAVRRFGSATNLNTHLHALVLDGVYQTTDNTGEGAPVFHPASASCDEQLQTLLDNIIRRSVRLLTRLGRLIEEEGITYLARTGDIDPDNVVAPLQAAASTYRIAMGPRAGRKVLTLVGCGERSDKWACEKKYLRWLWNAGFCGRRAVRPNDR